MSLSKLYSEIVAKAAVPSSSPEIQDIKSALEELMNRLVSGDFNVFYSGDIKYNKKADFTFRGSYLQPCGSMAEDTSLWKSVQRHEGEHKFIEFDYLTVLGNQDNVVRVGKKGFQEIKCSASYDAYRVNCKGCMEMYVGDNAFPGYLFKKAFLIHLNKRIDSMCSCHEIPAVTRSDDDNHDNRKCDQCTVVKNTGYLQLARVTEDDSNVVYLSPNGKKVRAADYNRSKVKTHEDCSLVLYWISRTDSLLAPNVETLQLTEQIKRLLIRVDLLPALEIPGNKVGDLSGLKRFIIPKDCPSCGSKYSYMVSYCMYEWNIIHNSVSEKHKQSYTIIKFLYGQFTYWTEAYAYLNTYHAKIAFLKHIENCTDDNDD